MKDVDMTEQSGIETVLDGLEWRCVGPHRGGRVVAVAGDPGDPNVFYFGAVAGGIWKTFDGGTYWENVSDGYLTTSAIGAIAVAPSDPNVIYAGSGEATIRGNVSHGDGIYRSTDAGKTWTNVGLRDTRHIGKIEIHPENPDEVYVAALGHAFGPNEERGVFRTKDGGKSWKRVLYRSPNAGAVDLSMDPHNPRILYATIWQARRYPWTLESAGPECGIFKSVDGGDNWTEITRNHGLPQGTLGKIGVAVSPARADRVYAIVEAEDGAVFRSDNGGETWQKMSDDPALRRRPWYYMHIYADPQDADTCWVLNLQCWKSTDGGKSFEAVPTPHGDNHDLWIDPTNPRRMIEGNDGGACVSYNGGRTWSTILNQPTAQFYHVTTDTRVPYRLYGSQQDNSALSVPSMSFDGAIGETEWFIPGGGESGYIAVRPDNPDIQFGGAIGSGFGNGLMWRNDSANHTRRNITVWPEVFGMGQGAEVLKYRFQWTFPIEISPHDPNVLYVAGNQLFCSTDEGASWTVLSPDLTRDDKSKQRSSGGPITKDNSGAEVYDTIFSFRESPLQKGLFWAGTDDGLAHISRDGGQTWENITPPDLPEWALVSMIELSSRDAGKAYLAATNYRLDDYGPYLYKTSDYGKTWHTIDDGIPENEVTRAIREDPVKEGVLYVGTETGIYVSFDDGGRWHRMNGKLPLTPIYDLVRKDGDLAVATHGRSFWILEDVALLHQLADGARAGSEPDLFAPAATPDYRFFSWSDTPRPGINYSHAGPLVIGVRQRELATGQVETALLDAGQNPPNGIAVRYWLPQKPNGEVTLTFLDADGNEIRTFSSKREKTPKSPATEVTEEVGRGVGLGLEGREGEPAEEAIEEENEEESQAPSVPKDAGMNRFVWDMRGEPATAITGDKSMKMFLAGATVLPGPYDVRLTVGDITRTQRFEIVPDPRRERSGESVREQHDLLCAIDAKVSAANQTVNEIRRLKDQLAIWKRRLKDSEGAGELLKGVEGLLRALEAVERELFSAPPKTDMDYTEELKLSGRMVALKFAVDFSDFAPTSQARDVYADLAAKIDAQVERFEEIKSKELANLNQQIREAGIAAVG